MINSSVRPEALQKKKKKKKKGRREAAIATREFGNVQEFRGFCRKRWGYVTKGVKSVPPGNNVK